MLGRHGARRAASSGSSASQDQVVYGIASRWQLHPGLIVQWINAMMPSEAGLSQVHTDPGSGEAVRPCSNEKVTINEG